MFLIYKDEAKAKRSQDILEGKSTRQKLTKAEIKFPVEELPGEDIDEVYGTYSGHADDILGVLNDIEGQINKDVAEGEKKTTFKPTMKEFLSDMGSQKAFIFAYRNKEGLNASLYTSQVEFNNACRAKKRSIKAIGDFSDAFEKHVISCSDILKNFGELDDRKMQVLTSVMDKVLGDEKISCDKKALGKMFDAMACQCLGRIPHLDEKRDDDNDVTKTLTPTEDTTANPSGQNAPTSTTQEDTVIANQQAELVKEEIPAPSAKVEAAQRSASEFYKRMKKFYE